MHEAVRPLHPDDAVQVAELERLARAAAAGFRGGSVWLQQHPPVGDWSAQIDTWVATIDDAIVGYLQLAVRGEVAEVCQVFVHPEARELGLGDALLEAAMTHARGKGCTAIEAVALPGDRDTKNLYERAGVIARLLVLRRGL